MKKYYRMLSLAAILLLLWLGWHWMRGHRALHVDQPSPEGAMSGANSVQNDPVKIFQRAFWASPTSEDTILHAERREWSDGEGILKWEWFLVVEPSPALLKRLRDDNVFGLVPVTSAAAIGNAPGWFRFDTGDVSVLKSPHGRLQLIFSRNYRTLYATDAGLGFTKGAPEPVRPAPQQAPVPGRLPMTPPPRPQP
jgi:hypothetical protein